MSNLRTEIINAQQVRSDLLKWKLLLVAGLGGASLGFSGNQVSGAELALCVIPFVCVYVDLLCRHLNLRNMIIGAFLRRIKPNSSINDNDLNFYYECFIGAHYKLLRDAENKSGTGNKPSVSTIANKNSLWVRLKSIVQKLNFWDTENNFNACNEPGISTMRDKSSGWFR